MKEILRFGIILAFVAMLAAASLSWVNAITKPRIEAQEALAIQKALYAVLPGCEQGLILSVTDPVEYYIGYENPDTTSIKGIAFQAASKGYSSVIKTMVGVDTSGTILAIRVLSQKETPGLGTRVEEIKSGESGPWWQKQFIGKPATEIKVDKDGGMIESVTGATITSRAITDGIARQARTILGQLYPEKNNEIE